MTRVVIINAVFPPEPVVSAYVGSDLAHYLADHGSTVTVLCPYPTRPLGARYSGFEPRPAPRIDREGQVEVVRLPSFTAPQSRLLPRIRESFSFGRHISRYLEDRLFDADVVYANSWPLLSQAFIARWCTRRRIPLVLHIQDVYPESLLTRLPRSLRGVAGAPLTALDRWTTTRAARVVVIGENMYRTYAGRRGPGRDKLDIIFNWQDEGRFTNLLSRNEVRARYGIAADAFVFMYLGNIGPVAGTELLIKAFARASLARAELLIVGEGSNKSACMSLASELHLTSVRFLACPTPFDAPILQQMADVCLLPMRSGTGISSIPSKLMAYLLSAKPVLGTLDADSDTANCIREAQCGWIGEPDDEEWLAQKMTELRGGAADVLQAAGERGRAYAMRHFTKAEGVARLASVVLAAGASSARADRLPS